MSDMIPDDLWRDFPNTAPAFEARFKTEEDCRAYWIQVRWGGKPADPGLGAFSGDTWVIKTIYTRFSRRIPLYIMYRAPYLYLAIVAYQKHACPLSSGTIVD